MSFEVKNNVEVAVELNCGLCLQQLYDSCLMLLKIAAFCLHLKKTGALVRIVFNPLSKV